MGNDSKTVLAVCAYIGWYPTEIIQDKSSNNTEKKQITYHPTSSGPWSGYPRVGSLLSARLLVVAGSKWKSGDAGGGARQEWRRPRFGCSHGPMVVVVARATEQGESGEAERGGDAAEVKPATRAAMGEEDANRADRLANWAKPRLIWIRGPILIPGESKRAEWIGREAAR